MTNYVLDSSRNIIYFPLVLVTLNWLLVGKKTAFAPLIGAVLKGGGQSGCDGSLDSLRHHHMLCDGIKCKNPCIRDRQILRASTITLCRQSNHATMRHQWSNPWHRGGSETDTALPVTLPKWDKDIYGILAPGIPHTKTRKRQHIWSLKHDSNLFFVLCFSCVSILMQIFFG